MTSSWWRMFQVSQRRQAAIFRRYVCFASMVNILVLNDTHTAHNSLIQVTVVIVMIVTNWYNINGTHFLRGGERKREEKESEKEIGEKTEQKEKIQREKRRERERVRNICMEILKLINLRQSLPCERICPLMIERWGDCRKCPSNQSSFPFVRTTLLSSRSR